MRHYVRKFRGESGHTWSILSSRKWQEVQAFITRRGDVTITRWQLSHRWKAESLIFGSVLELSPGGITTPRCGIVDFSPLLTTLNLPCRRPINVNAGRARYDEMQYVPDISVFDLYLGGRSPKYRVPTHTASCILSCMRVLRRNWCVFLSLKRHGRHASIFTFGSSRFLSSEKMKGSI